MGLRDLKNNLSITQSLHPATRTATASGTGVDLQGAKAALVEFNFGAWASGVWTPSVEESDDNSAWSAVAAADLEGSLTAVDSGDDDNVAQRAGYKGTKRYIRAVLTTASSPASLPCGASVIIEPNAKPA